MGHQLSVLNKSHKGAELPLADVFLDAGGKEPDFSFTPYEPEHIPYGNDLGELCPALQRSCFYHMQPSHL